MCPAGVVRTTDVEGGCLVKTRPCWKAGERHEPTAVRMTRTATFWWVISLSRSMLGAHLVCSTFFLCGA